MGTSNPDWLRAAREVVDEHERLGYGPMLTDAEHEACREDHPLYTGERGAGDCDQCGLWAEALYAHDGSVLCERCAWGEEDD